LISKQVFSLQEIRENQIISEALKNQNWIKRRFPV